MSRAHRSLAAALALSAALAAACGDDPTPTSSADAPTSSAAAPTSAAPATAPPVIDPGDGGDYDPDLDPADFVDRIDHPLLPFTPGSRWVYEGLSDGEVERIEVVVTDDAKTVMGIDAVVVRDTVTLDGELVEDTFDWYAQDKDGTVWYLGEDSTEYEGGVAINKDGSWEAGVDGAEPGVAMLAEPSVGDAYRQELLPGVAEDLGEVLRTGGTVTVPAGDFEDVLVTEDWNPLDPDTIEEKTYAPGVGLVLEVKTAGGEARVELVDFEVGA